MKKKGTFTPWRIGLIGVFVVTVLLYLPSVNGAAFWDDDPLISGSAIGGGTFIGALTSPFFGMYFRPLTSISFVIDTAYGHFTPFYYHQTNILFHAATAVLVSCLALQITGRWLAGILAGLFFASQPMQVGAAAWIGGRTDVLSAFFLAAFMVTLVQYHQRGKVGWIVASILALLLAALSKEQAIAALPAVPISVFALGSRKWKDAIKITAPFAVVAALYLVAWYLVTGVPNTSPLRFSSLFLALRTAAHYGVAWIIPNRPSLVTYTLDNYASPIWIAVGASFVVGFAYLIRGLWKNHRSVAWVLLTGLFVYLPICNFPPVPSLQVGPYRVAESGVAIACALGIASAYFICSKRYLVALLPAANLLGGLLVTWIGIHLWLNPLRLFSACVSTDPYYIDGVANYVKTLNDRGRREQANEQVTRILTWIFGTSQWPKMVSEEKVHALSPPVLARLRTNFGVPYPMDVGLLMVNYASNLVRVGKADEARVAAQDATYILPEDDRVYCYFADLEVGVDRVKAIRAWETALAVSPQSTDALASLGHERVKDKRYVEAIALLKPALKKAGWNSQAWLDLVDAEIAVHDYSKAKFALEGAAHAFAPPKGEIERRRNLLESLTAKPR